MLKSQRIISTLKILFKSSKKFCSNQAPTDSIVYTTHTKYVTEILLNKPKALNAVDMKMVKSLLKTCRAWLPDDSAENGLDSLKSNNEGRTDVEIPKVVIMSGAGGKAFCAGGDVVSIYNLRKQNKPMEEVCEFFK